MPRATTENDAPLKAALPAGSSCHSPTTLKILAAGFRHRDAACTAARPRLRRPGSFNPVGQAVHRGILGVNRITPARHASLAGLVALSWVGLAGDRGRPALGAKPGVKATGADLCLRATPS
jgi:hypothetical protein